MSKISGFFEKLFRNSLFLKILSVVIAIGIWLYIVNVADPRRTEEYTNVPIAFVYEGTVPYNNALMPLVTNRSFYVNLRVSGPRTSLMNFSKDKITAFEKKGNDLIITYTHVKAKKDKKAVVEKITFKNS